MSCETDNEDGDRLSGSFIRMPHSQQGLPPPDITHHITRELVNSKQHSHAGSVRLQPPASDPVGTLYCKGKVSTKIQQLLNTLKVNICDACMCVRTLDSVFDVPI